MSLTRHPFRGEPDSTRLLGLIRSMPPSCRHVLDFPWRLSSPPLQDGQDAAYWDDASGRIVGFGAWQPIWGVLDFYILPGPQQAQVATDLFQWAGARMRDRDAGRGQPAPYWAEYRDDDAGRHSLLQAHGFGDDEDHYVLLEHPLTDLPPVPALPVGMRLRPLAGAAEAAAYAAVHRAAFESTSMTAEWRRRTLRMPLYRPALDLVVVAPDASLAGFCVGWLDPERRWAQIEPIGVHPRFAQQGLARVLLLKMLRRFQEHGATRAFVETNVERMPARRAYESVGFQTTHIIRRASKWATPPEAG